MQISNGSMILIAKKQIERHSGMGFRHDRDVAECAQIRLQLLGQDTQDDDEIIIRHVAGLTLVPETYW